MVSTDANYPAIQSTSVASQGISTYGLQQIVNIILSDPGLARRIPQNEIKAGANAADGMNKILVEAIMETGIAHDGTINTADVRDLNDFIRGNYLNKWTVLHGDDYNNGRETGFHLVQADGATTQLYGKNAVNAVADGLYHLGFEIRGGNLVNEDGDTNAPLKTIADWLSRLLQQALADGSLVKPGSQSPYFTATTGTGLDQLVEIITSDPGLNQKISTTEINTGASDADAMNAIIIEAIEQTGAAVDGKFDAADVRDLNGYIRANHLNTWKKLHGDDEGNAETGFHLVQADGATTKLYGKNAVNIVGDGLYHLGFEIKINLLTNEDGDKNASVFAVADWLNRLLKDDLADGSLVVPGVDPTFQPTTGTGLDRLVNIIVNDKGLNQRIPGSEINEGAEAADGLNKLIIEAIQQTGTALDGTFTRDDVRDLNTYLRANHAKEWTKLHGDDYANGRETGFHLVQADGAKTMLYGQNAVNAVADGLYHMGFKIAGSQFLNEDGDKSAGLLKVAGWLNKLLAEDFGTGALTKPTAAPDPSSIVYSLGAPITVSKAGDQVEVNHFKALELEEGSIEVAFTADRPNSGEYYVLYSKDGYKFGDGGQFSALVHDGELIVKLETTNKSFYFWTGDNTIKAGQEYHAVFTFGDEGASLYLNGTKVNTQPDFDGGIETNTEDLAIGIGTQPRRPDHPDWRMAPWDGKIEAFNIYDQQLSNQEVANLAQDYDALIG